MSTLESMTEPELLLLMRGEKPGEALSVSGEPSFREALTELLLRQYDWLRRMCLLEFRYSQEAEDCLQEVLIEISKSMKSFDGRSELKTWMYVIAKRTIYRVRKSARKREERFPLGKKEDIGERDTLDAQVRDTESLLAEKEASRAIVRFIRSLPEQQRWAVFFHYFEDLSLEDTAARLNCSIGSVKKHLFRGRQKIKELLESEEPA